MFRRKRPPATRRNISVPPRLKKKMDAVDEYVNWSAVACQSWQVKLDEIDEKTIGIEREKW